MKKSGWLCIWRSILDDPLWKQKREFSEAEAFLDILLCGQHSPDPQPVHIGSTTLYCNRGESLKSKSTWAERWCWDESRVRRFLKRLEARGSITLTNEVKTTRIKISNYDTYQHERRQIDGTSDGKSTGLSHHKFSSYQHERRQIDGTSDGKSTADNNRIMRYNNISLSGGKKRKTKRPKDMKDAMHELMLKDVSVMRHYDRL